MTPLKSLFLLYFILQFLPVHILFYASEDSQMVIS